MKLAAISILALVQLTLGSGQGLAWGDLGHSTVGGIAYELLTPATREHVDQLLGGRTLAEASTWPDLNRSNPDFRNTDIGNWHFSTIDSKTGQPTLVENTIFAIQLMTDILADKVPAYTVRKKNPQIPTKSIVIGKMEALYFLAHFIGDIHQPLHVGNEVDKGANMCVVKWHGAVRKGEEFWSLHSVWDEGLIEQLKLGRSDLIGDLLNRLKVVSRRDIEVVDNPLRWALESAAIRPDLYPQLDPQHPVSDTEQPYCHNPKYEKLPWPGGPNRTLPNMFDVEKFDAMEKQLLADPDVPRLGYDYTFAHIETAKLQMLKAGVRLAYMLESIFAK